MADLAKIFGVSLPTVRESWLREGMPFAVQGRKGRQWEFETSEVLDWWARNKFKSRAQVRQNPADPFDDSGEEPETKEQAERRKEIAHADRAEVAVAKEAGLLVPIDEVAKIVVEENARVRARLLSIPTKIRPRALVLLNSDRTAAEQVVAAVEEEVLDALTEVQSWAPEPEGDGDDE